MSQHASTANHDERDDQRKSHTLITDARCVLARVHLSRVLIIMLIKVIIAPRVLHILYFTKDLQYFSCLLIVDIVTQNNCIN